MSRFFVQAAAIAQDRVEIVGGDANHIARVLRLRVGEEITVCDMQRKEYRCALLSVNGERVTAQILEEKQNETEPSYRAVLYQALPKGDKMETLIQKAVECGVSEIVPFASEHCVVKLDAQGGKKKQERWQKIAQSAAEQSGRGIVVQVREPISFAQAVQEAAQAQVGFLCYEGERSCALGQVLTERAQSIAFLIGPEGGFSQKEVAQATQAGLASVGLGKRILRTETASTFVLSCLVYHYELQGEG